jgi:cytochrome b subunit of formate dehydrogenase
MKNSLRYWLVKSNRLSAWLLLAFMVLFLASGYVMIGQYGLSSIMGRRIAVRIHTGLDIPLVALFVYHSSASVYLAMVRWGWIR